MDRLNDPHEPVGTLKLYMSYGNEVIENLPADAVYYSLDS